MKLSVIIPVYNEEATIISIIEQVIQVPLEKQIIIVNDGSTDATGALLSRYATEVDTIVSHERNEGKGAAIQTGLKYVTGDLVWIQDGDLEILPKAVLPLYRYAISHPAIKVVIGSRFLKDSLRSRSKKLNSILHFIASIFFGNVPADITSGFRIIQTKLLKSLSLQSRGFGFETEMTLALAEQQLAMYEVPVDYIPRGYRQGKKLKYSRHGIVIIALIVGRWVRLQKDRVVRNTMLLCNIVLPDSFMEKRGWLTFKALRHRYVLKEVYGYTLDIGCGTNEFIREYKNGIGLDSHEWSGIDVLGSATKLPFAGESFDTVTFIASLNHVGNISQALAEAWRVLRPGGRLVVTMIGPIVGFLAHKIIWHDVDQHERTIGADESWGISTQALLKHFNSAKFKLVKHERFAFGLNNMYVAEKI